MKIIYQNFQKYISHLANKKGAQLTPTKAFTLIRSIAGKIPLQE
jgi:hypothetical protein